MEITINQVITQIKEGTYRIGAFAILVGAERGYPTHYILFAAACFAATYLLGAVEILRAGLGL